MEAIVQYNQTLQDISIAHTGRVDNAYAIAQANGIDNTDDLQPGQVVEIPSQLSFDNDVVRYYRNRKHKPATALPVLIAEETDYFPAFPGMLDLMLS